MKTSKVHHFADDTNLLFINKSLKLINKNKLILINHDLAHLNTLIPKLSRAVGLLSKIWYHTILPSTLLRTIYISLFLTHHIPMILAGMPSMGAKRKSN